MRVASRSLTREQDGISGFLAYPAAAARKPGILLLHHAHGVTADLKSTVVDLAHLGYAALVPNLYHMLGEPAQSHIGRGAELQQRLNDGEFLRVIGDSWRYLARRADVDPTRTGVLAHSMGGRLAIPFVADTPEVRALVLYYPSIRDEIETELRPRHAFDLARTLKCPSMMIYGGLDHIAGAETRRRLWESFQANGQAFEWHFYSYARHGFASPDSEGYQPELAAMVWPLATGFLHRALVEPPLA
ncbi:MAG: dienelactone hydrolase family protein [Burkholderiales bacterium]|nr:dienelactone hydrolase family protein [Burkholderiales bacterium]